MSWTNALYTLSNINAVLGSYKTYAQDKDITNFGLNVLNGAARNEVANERSKFGDMTGYAINMVTGYGNPTANTNGTMGLLATTPMFGFGMPWFGGNMFGCGMFGGSMFGGSIWGGGYGMGCSYMPTSTTLSYSTKYYC